MSWNVITKLMDYLKDAHMLVALLVFTVTTFVHVHTKVDLGPQYVNSLYAMYAFLGGHAWANRNNGNGGDDQK